MARMSRRALVGALAMAPFAGCASTGADADLSSLLADTSMLSDLERRIGGRLGLAMVDQFGSKLASYRADERFAMCSTFKAPLAGVMLRRSMLGDDPISTQLPVTPADIVAHSPRLAEALNSAGERPLTMSIAELCQATVQVSDNGAANILLRHIGGPAAFTSAVRALGDTITRLDRYETLLNANQVGDPRDTSTPLAMARLTSAFCFGEALDAAGHLQLRDWLAGASNGLNRIRAGVPAGWDVGNKIGTGGATALAVNDVAYIIARHRPPGRLSQPLVLAIMTDRPTAAFSEVEAGLAEATRTVIATWRGS